jgi:hypothetical protein
MRVIDDERLEAEDSTFRYADTYEAGVYNINWRRRADEEKIAVAVNYDPDEVDPAIVAQVKLSKRFDSETLVFCEDPQTSPTRFAGFAKAKAFGRYSY